MDDRRVLIVYDVNAVRERNESVFWAKAHLAKHLRSRGAAATWFDWPADAPASVNGIDDLLAAVGPRLVLPLLEAAFERAALPPDLIAHHFTDTGNADRLIEAHGADMRYGWQFRKWFLWSGTHWVADETGRARLLAKQTMVAFLRQGVEKQNEGAEKFARASLSSKSVHCMLLEAQSELPVTPRDLDSDAHLLNFSNGTVDLRTGLLSRHQRGDWITKIVPYAYRPDAKCPQWLKFLADIMGYSPEASEAQLDRGAELINFLQLALGYAITGDASEKVFFFLYGSGDNGKTTLLAVVRDLIRDYSATVGLDLLTSKEDTNNVSSARANLRGARFVCSNETEEGEHFIVSRLKRLTQGSGGEIEACRKYENPIVFPETHKLFVDANHKPNVPATDHAFWNRARLIPFTITIPKDQQDRNLKDKLMAEGEGILAWLVAGAVRWHAEGLPNSPAVAAATGAWREEMNRLGAYLEEKTEKVLNKEAWVLNKVLYADYQYWCEFNGERALSQPRFSSQMESMGYAKEHTEKGNIWKGVRLLTS